MPNCLEERISCFVEVITKDKVQKIAEELEVSNSKEKKKKQATLRIKKQNAQAAAYFSTGNLCRSFAAEPMSDLSTLSASAPSTSTRFAAPMPHLYTSSTSAGPVRSAMPMPYLFAPFTFTKLAGSIDFVSGLSVLFAFAPSASTPSASAGSAIPRPCFSTSSISVVSVSTPFASSKSVLPVSGLFASATPVFELSAFSGLVVTSIPER